MSVLELVSIFLQGVFGVLNYSGASEQRPDLSVLVSSFCNNLTR
jgi:hypothetical protein